MYVSQYVYVSHLKLKEYKTSVYMSFSSASSWFPAAAKGERGIERVAPLGPRSLKLSSSCCCRAADVLKMTHHINLAS
jgi:hypothetical protein